MLFAGLSAGLSAVSHSNLIPLHYRAMLDGEHSGLTLQEASDGLRPNALIQRTFGRTFPADSCSSLWHGEVQVRNVQVQVVRPSGSQQTCRTLLPHSAMRTLTVATVPQQQPPYSPGKAVE